MSNCLCSDYAYDLGCFCHCDRIILPITVPYTGIFNIEYKYLGVVNVRRMAFLRGDQFMVEGRWFNEESRNEFKIMDENFNVMAFQTLNPLGDMCVEYTKFIMQTRVCIDRFETCPNERLICSSDCSLKC